jgi:hypothetical protein
MMHSKEESMWQPLVNLIAGLWIVFSGYSENFSVAGNVMLIGVVVAIMGFWRSREWEGMVCGILGLWLIVSSIFPVLLGPANLTIIGLAIAVIAAGHLFALRRHPHAAGGQPVGG